MKILNSYMKNVIKTYNSLDNLKTDANNLKNGESVNTLGYYSAYDGGG